MRRDLALPLAFAMTVATGAAQGQQDRTMPSETTQVQIETLAQGLEHPWGMDFLPDGRLLVTERPGRLRVVGKDGQVSEPLAGVPKVFAQGQGGLLDVAVAPDFAQSRRVYFSYAEPGENRTAGTAVARARLTADATSLEDLEVIFRQTPKVDDSKHFGSRLAFTRDGKLFVTLGERFKFDPAQDLGNHLGTVVRLNLDGSVPPDNPFAQRDGARPEIWSYGHRNIEAAAIHLRTGALWIAEMGPKGGDELNRPEAGQNHGWPLVSHGEHYDGRDIPDPSTRPDLADAVHQWTPVISPSGMAFYTGDLFDGWRGSMLIGGLSAKAVVRVELDGDRFAGEERIRLDARVRDVQQGPDGAVYAATDEANGRILRLTPAARGAARDGTPERTEGAAAD